MFIFNLALTLLRHDSMSVTSKQVLDLGQEGGDLSLSIDTVYAHRYEKRKRGEELSKLKEKYGSDIEGSSYASSSDLEDEYGKGLSIENDKSFLRVLSLIKENNDSLYDTSVKYYATESDTSLSEEETALYLRDYEREKLLEKGAELYDSGSDYEGESKLGYDPEQREIKRDLLEAVRDDNTDNNDDLTVSDFLHRRVKSKAELAREEVDYSEWLKTNPLTEIETPSSISIRQADDLKNLRNFWSQRDLNEEDKFLRDYLLEKRHLGVEVGEGSDGDQSQFDDQDLEQLDEADEFERKYNFRFEEDDSSLVARYPRNITNSVRREDTRRKDHRKLLAERKEREKIQEREEIKRLKNLKKMDIQDKIDLIKKITGNSDLGVNTVDLSADFDSEQYDNEMNSIFNQDYFEEKEYEKPDLSSILPPDLQDTDSETADYQLGDNLYCEDDGFIMDADYIEERALKNSKREQVKISHSSNSNLNRQMDEYYNLDYEDKIGDIACRMKYRQVVPNSFGLTTEEILTAEDRELNQWASLKKTVQFRSQNEERRDVKKYSKKARNLSKKRRVFLSLFEEDSVKSKKRDTKDFKNNSTENPILTKQQKRILNNKKLSDKQKNIISDMSSTRLKAYHIDPKRGLKRRN
ncbi:Protein KRI1-like [Oopsacas minuta]|uniref:Protein KRI1 homolog n=1 Tax=Oopsacas minuta TaxID=111878 RepID=A0AAV7JKM4_9METZ|nr:Protein KRI1-like [Oopsacas minuta]